MENVESWTFSMTNPKFKNKLETSEFDLLASGTYSAYQGIGLVKLMGRNSGFMAMHASLASGQVNVCLIPEVCL